METTVGKIIASKSAVYFTCAGENAECCESKKPIVDRTGHGDIVSFMQVLKGNQIPVKNMSHCNSTKKADLKISLQVSVCSRYK